MSNFLYALKIPNTRKKYTERLKFFFNSVFENQKDIESQAIEFVKKAKSDDWVYSAFINFITTQNKRIEKGEVTAGTVRNYYKPAKLFCDQNDIIVNWKKITRGMMKEKQYADDKQTNLSLNLSYGTVLRTGKT